jgi:hypothetical protein
MSEDQDIERLVEKQARGEAPGVPVEGAAFESGQLDTRRSKSSFAASSLLGQTHVDVPGADVDSQSYIAQQTGIIVEGVAPDPTAQHLPVPDPSAQSAAEPEGVFDANQYPDIVDQPGYILAHSNPALVQDQNLLGELRTPETEIQIGPDQAE